METTVWIGRMMRVRVANVLAGRRAKTRARWGLRAFGVLICGYVGLVVVSSLSADAQTRAAPSVGAQTEQTPNPRRAAIRFVTTNDFPPFNYAEEDGTLAGLNVELARLVCSELSALCDLQVRPWDDLLVILRRGEADAVIASHAISPRLLTEFQVSERYYFTPGRFVGRRDGAPLTAITPSGLDGKRIGVARATAHEAYLRAFFTSSLIRSYENADLARDALRLPTPEIDLVFDDGIGLVFWINGEASKLCCEFKGGAFVEPRYFGDGVGIVMGRNDLDLKLQIDGALRRLREAGRMEELMLRYFPLRPY
jgi:polar amino acid transport system substrate-binding protein